MYYSQLTINNEGLTAIKVKGFDHHLLSVSQSSTMPLLLKEIRKIWLGIKISSLKISPRN